MRHHLSLTIVRNERNRNMCSEMNSEQPAGDSRTDHTHATGVAQSRIMIDSNISNICSYRFGITGKFPTIYSGQTYETPLQVVYTDERPAQPGKIKKRGRQGFPHQRKPICIGRKRMTVTVFTNPSKPSVQGHRTGTFQTGRAVCGGRPDAEPSTFEQIKNAGFKQIPVVISPNFSWSGHRPDLIHQLAQSIAA